MGRVRKWLEQSGEWRMENGELLRHSSPFSILLSSYWCGKYKWQSTKYRKVAQDAKRISTLCVLGAFAVQYYFFSRSAFGNGVEVSVRLASSTFSGKRIVLESLFNFSLILIELKSTSEVSFDFMALQKYVFSLPEMLYVLCNVTVQSCFLPQRHREQGV